MRARPILPREHRCHDGNIRGMVTKAIPALPVVLDLPASARVRDQMLAELNDIGSADDAAKWAHRRLAEKNKLNAADARHIEEIFRAKLLSFAIHEAEGSSQSEDRSAHPSSALSEQKAKKRSAAKTVDKSVLAHPEPRRVRDRDHVRYVAKQPCLDLRPPASGCSSSALCAKPSAWPKSQRRIHSATMPRTSSRAASTAVMKWPGGMPLKLIRTPRHGPCGSNTSLT